MVAADYDALGKQFRRSVFELSNIVEPKPVSYGAEFIDSAAFMDAQFHQQWLIKNMLVADQPAIIGGAKKVLKTSLLLDMAISIATGTKFLNHFEVETA